MHELFPGFFVNSVYSQYKYRPSSKYNMDKNRVYFEAVIFVTTFIAVWVLVRLFTNATTSQLLLISVSLALVNTLSRIVAEKWFQ
jgi:hypothetical protein